MKKKMDRNNLPWTEKYRPKNIDEILGRKEYNK